MADFWQLVSVLQQHAKAALSRTDVLRSLTWLVGLLLLATFGLVTARADQWIIITLAALFVVSVLVFLGSHVYCLIFDRDALRSERYLIERTAIEHGLRGDSETGTFDPDEVNPQITESSKKQIEHKP